MSDALRSLEYIPGAGLQPVGAGVSGMVGGQPECAVCHHPHRRALDESLVFDAACGCGCTVSGRTYTYGAADLDYEHIDQYDAPRCAAHDLATVDDDDCDSAAGPRCLPGGGRGSERGDLAPGPPVRGHAVDGTGSAIRRWPGYDASDVGELRRTGVRFGRGAGNSRTADDCGEPNRTAALLGHAFGRLSRLVTLGPRGWSA